MARTVGRGAEKPKETIESIKKDLETAKSAGIALIKKNKELEEKLKKQKETIEAKENKIKELEETIKLTKSK